MLKSRVTRRKVASRPYASTTSKSQTKDYQYNKGFNSNISNDDVPTDQLVYITDAREVQIGKWKTKQGTDFFSVPIGEAVNVAQTSLTGTSNFTFNGTTRWAKKVVATTNGRLTLLMVNLKNTAGATGTVTLSLHADSASKPGTELVRTTIPNSAVTSTYQYLSARTITCPDVVSGTTYWVTGYVTSGDSAGYQISTTTSATTGLTSIDSGQTWTASNVDYNVQVLTSTASGVKGHIRIKRPGGSSYTFMAHGTTLYSINETTGATTAVDTNLGAASTFVRFDFVNDTLYYVDGTQKPRKYDFTTSSSVTTAPENARGIKAHKGLLFYMSASDESKYFWTDFLLYDKFNVLDIQYVPSPKNADSLKAIAGLTGNLYWITRNNKYVLYGKTNATFTLENALGQKGTFSQESTATDEDYIYLASDDGIYRFNGAEETNIAMDVLDWWTGVSNKENTVLELFNNRLYVFYTPPGQSANSRCKVYNTLYGIWESDDTNTYIGRSYSRLDADNYMLVGSNRVGMLMLNERNTNDYTNMGEPLTYELRSKYEPYQAPAQLKRAPSFRPHFDAVAGNYAVQTGYATDFSDSPTYSDISLAPTGVRFNEGSTFDSGIRFSGTAQINPMDSAPLIPGQWRRLQIRYKHYAAREPISFDGHVMTIEQERIS